MRKTLKSKLSFILEYGTIGLANKEQVAEYTAKRTISPGGGCNIYFFNSFNTAITSSVLYYDSIDRFVGVVFDIVSLDLQDFNK